MKTSCHVLLALVLVLALALALGVSLSQDADACSRVLWASGGNTISPNAPVIVGRTEDWVGMLRNKFRVFPRGIRRDGLAEKNSLSWKSKYGSLVLTMLDVGTHEGMNEKGLSARMLYLPTNYGARDETRPGLVVSLWPQYILDNFATVEEAVKSLTETNVQIIPINLPPGVEAPFHLSIEDAKGDSAIIEVVDGHTIVYRGKKYIVMTNAPTYDKQMDILAEYIKAGFKPLPGTLESQDRFVRAYYYAKRLIPPQDGGQAVSFMFSLLGNISVPFAVELEDYPTWWRTVMDLTNRVYFFGSTLKPNVVLVNMSKLNFAPHAYEKELDVECGPDLSGDISHRLKIAKKFLFKASSTYDPKTAPIGCK